MTPENQEAVDDLHKRRLHEAEIRNAARTDDLDAFSDLEARDKERVEAVAEEVRRESVVHQATEVQRRTAELVEQGRQEQDAKFRGQLKRLENRLTLMAGIISLTTFLTPDDKSTLVILLVLWWGLFF